MAAPFRALGVERVLGIESRGFLFAAPIALALGVGLGLVRKQGKLPFDTLQARYELEYGVDTVEMHVDAVRPRPARADRGRPDRHRRHRRRRRAARAPGRRRGGGCSFLIELAALGGWRAWTRAATRCCGSSEADAARTRERNWSSKRRARAKQLRASPRRGRGAVRRTQRERPPAPAGAARQVESLGAGHLARGSGYDAEFGWQPGRPPPARVTRSEVGSSEASRGRSHGSAQHRAADGMPRQR